VSSGQISGTPEQPDEVDLPVTAFNSGGKQELLVHVLIREALPDVAYEPLEAQVGVPARAEPALRGGPVRARAALHRACVAAHPGPRAYRAGVCL
jgi:hypothetical protein